jgi:hypothetical protein
LVAAGPPLLLLVAAVGALGLLPPLLPLPQVVAAGDWAAAAAAAGSDAAGVFVCGCVESIFLLAYKSEVAFCLTLSILCQQEAAA